MLLPHIRFFEKSEKGLEQVSQTHFLHILGRKKFILFYCILLIDQVSLSECLYFVRCWAISVLQLFVNQAVTSWILKFTLLSNQVLFSTWPKSLDKNLNISRTKRAFKIKWKAFIIIFKGLSMKQITILLKVRVRP